MLTPRILVTRPLPQAEVTADQIRANGGDPVIEPLMTIRDHPENLPNTTFSAILTTSQEAIKALALTTTPRQTPLWCAGKRSKLLAHELGFTNVRAPETSGAQGLLEDFMARMDPSTGPILYASGDVITLDLATELALRGYDCTRAILYSTEAAESLSQPLEELDGIVFFSKRSVDIFLTLLGSKPTAPLHAAFLSMEIANHAQQAPWKSITIPDNMNSEQMIGHLIRKIHDDKTR
jgi:uroporphyrinogen-III synthase